MKPRYITLIVTCNDGGRAYVVADRTKIFFDEKKARAVRDCLNEQDADIVRGSEDGKDAGRGRYHAVYNQARDCWDLMFRDVLCASFYVGRYPCAEDKVDAEVSRLNAEYGKEQNNGGIL